jgi:CRP-like cAMP-binding protein
MSVDRSTLPSGLPAAIAEAFPRSLDGSRMALATAAHIRRFGVGQAILQQGDESSLALIMDGHVAIRRTTVDGRQLMVSIVEAGGLATILPLAGRPAGADAVTLTPTKAAVWDVNDVRPLAKMDPGLAVDLLDHVLDRFEEVVDRLDGLLHQNALRRVARVLDTHADLFFAEQPVLTRAHLPTLVGTSREMTGRVLRILESRRLVARVGRNRLVLLDGPGLRAMAGAAAHQSPAVRARSSASVAIAGRRALDLGRRPAIPVWRTSIVAIDSRRRETG